MTPGKEGPPTLRKPGWFGELRREYRRQQDQCDTWPGDSARTIMEYRIQVESLQKALAQDEKRTAALEELLSKSKVLVPMLPTCENTCDLTVGPHRPECEAASAVEDSIDKIATLTPAPKEEEEKDTP